jgi:Arc/MetJ-type ribon-helix-helix transcriptional regulator
MTRYEKITISLPSRAAENARKAVKEGRASSVSAYIVEALHQQTKTDDWDVVFAEMMEETGGPMKEWERRAADRALGLLPNGEPDPNAPQII